MKQLLLTLTAVLCISFSYAQNQNQGIGQQDRPQRMTAKQMTTNMVKKLNLDDKQAKKVQKLNNSYSELFEGPGGGNGQRPPMGGGNRPQGGQMGSGRPQGGFGGGQGGFGGQRPQMSGDQQQSFESMMKERQKKQEKYQLQKMEP